MCERIGRTYEADASVFPNPERGFWQSFNPPGGGLPGNFDTPHSPLDRQELALLRDQGISLIRDCILIGERQGPLAEDTLQRLEEDFSACRKAGIKSVPRFVYNWGMSDRDAPPDVVLGHVEQLAPLLRRNSDVIFYLQLGVLGGTGEGGASEWGYGDFKGICEPGRRLIRAFLDALPPERMLGLRFTAMKRQFLGAGFGDWLDESEAFTNADRSRLCYFSDCALYDWKDVNFYERKMEAKDKQFFLRDSRFVIHSGEPFMDSEFALKADAVSYLGRYHWTAMTLNQCDAPMLYEKWKQSGEMDEIRRRMGYRFTLEAASTNAEARPGSVLEVCFTVRNDGFAGIMNPRGISLLLREKSSARVYEAKIERGRGNRLFLPQGGAKVDATIRARLALDVPDGCYELLLWLPDPCGSIRGRSEYSIRLANSGIWEPASGCNTLGLEIFVRGEAADDGESECVFTIPSKGKG